VSVRSYLFLTRARFSWRMPSMRSLQRGALGALLVTTACALAACGGGGGSAASTDTTATTTTSTTPAAGAANGANSAAFAKYTACLKQNGVTLPSFGAGRPPGGADGGGPGNPPTGSVPAPPTGTNPPGGQGGPGGFDSAKFQKASAACAKLRPAGTRGFGGGFGRGNTQNNAAFAAYRNCLTLHGVKITALRQGGAAPTAKVQKAMTACASLRPQRQAPPASTTTAPTTTDS
jgi:hypothetical protein